MSIVHSSFFEWVSPNSYLPSKYTASRKKVPSPKVFPNILLISRINFLSYLWSRVADFPLDIVLDNDMTLKENARKWYDSMIHFWVFRAADSSGVQSVCDWFWSRSAIIGSHMTTSPPLSLTMSPIPRWRELELSFHYDLYFCFRIKVEIFVCLSVWNVRNPTVGKRDGLKFFFISCLLSYIIVIYD